MGPNNMPIKSFWQVSFKLAGIHLIITHFVIIFDNTNVILEENKISKARVIQILKQDHSYCVNMEFNHGYFVMTSVLSVAWLSAAFTY